MIKTLWVLTFALLAMNVQAGVINPDCTAEKAAKSAAAKATVGVGGRCDPKEAAADSVGLKDKKDAVSDVKDNAADKVDGVSEKEGRKALKKAVTN